MIAWGAAVLTCVSLAVFVLMSEPRGGQPNAIGHRWLTSSLACCAVAAILAGAAIAFAVMCFGVVLLTQTSPATMKADAATADAEVLSEPGEGTR